MNENFKLHRRPVDRQPTGIHVPAAERTGWNRKSSASSPEAFLQRRLMHTKLQGIREVSVLALQHSDPEETGGKPTGILSETTKGKFCLRGVSARRGQQTKQSRRIPTRMYAKPYSGPSASKKAQKKNEKTQNRTWSSSASAGVQTAEVRRFAEPQSMGEGASYVERPKNNSQRTTTSIYKREISRRGLASTNKDIERPYSCPMCKKGYGTLSAVSMHLRLKHERIVRRMMGLKDTQQVSSHHGRSVAGFINDIHKDSYLIPVCSLDEALRSQAMETGVDGSIEGKQDKL
eukprot:gb/GECG01001073.1/.p1 GENE.gb/GECG01001073.1/~~gb/GECG01001073.1/.p1  ORF type:complete len:290 (+),score=35.70 gb/GECG01001073.1/:1-870(+)